MDNTPIRKKTIYAIDFDGTIAEEDYPRIGNPIKKTIAFIQNIQTKGDKWILLTMREGNYLQEALAFLYENGLFPDAVNDNLPERVARWKNNPRKVYADIYIDDHNAGGLFIPDEIYANEMLNIVKEKLNSLFHRKATTQWSDKEISALKKVSKRDNIEQELKSISEQYSSDYPYKRSSILILLNNWTTELDRIENKHAFTNVKEKRYYANGKNIGTKPEHFSRSDDF